jgi:diadenosine tetraphosphate (Ap4A) HIT family hydrolase
VKTAIHERVERLRAGGEPAQILRMRSGWAVLGAQQFLRGYSLLLPDPVVPHLNAMTGRDRAAFLDDMSALGDAVLKVTGARRINYALFGNAEPALHAHVIPRFDEEPEALRSAHPWSYDWSAAPRFNPAEHGRLLEAIRAALITRVPI